MNMGGVEKLDDPPLHLLGILSALKIPVPFMNFDATGFFTKLL